MPLYTRSFGEEKTIPYLEQKKCTNPKFSTIVAITKYYYTASWWEIGRLPFRSLAVLIMMILCIASIKAVPLGRDGAKGKSIVTNSTLPSATLRGVALQGAALQGAALQGVALQSIALQPALLVAALVLLTWLGICSRCLGVFESTLHTLVSHGADLRPPLGPILTPLQRLGQAHPADSLENDFDIENGVPPGRSQAGDAISGGETAEEGTSE